MSLEKDIQPGVQWGECNAINYCLLITVGVILRDAEQWDIETAAYLTHPHTQHKHVRTPELFETLSYVFCCGKDSA